MGESDVRNDQNPSDADLAMLAWQVEMGADEAIADAVVDRFALSLEQSQAQPTGLAEASRQTRPCVPAQVGHQRAPRQASYKSTPAPAAAQPVAADQDAIVDARKLAASCHSIDDLVKALTGFDSCALTRTASNLCFFDGNRDARILMIGEAPGRDEDLQGKPFVGRSGQLLDKILHHIGLDRHATDPGDSVLISNTVFWRPPGNRKPTEAETLTCLPFVNRLIELTMPDIIVCLGATPTQRLTGETRGITRLRGRWFDYPVNCHGNGSGNGSVPEAETSGDNTTNIPVLATLHPSYLLRQPAQKRLAWRDFLALKDRMTKPSNAH